MCETFAYLRRNCKLFLLPSQSKSIHNFPYASVEEKNQSSQLEDRISAVRDKSSSGSYFYNYFFYAAFENTVCCNMWLLTDSQDLWKSKKELLSSKSKFMKIFFCSNGFPNIFFFCLLAANQRKWKEVRIVNAKIMIWAGNLNLDYAARFLFPEEYCVVVLVLHNSIIVHHHLAKCYVRVLSPFFFFLSPWILLG